MKIVLATASERRVDLLKRLVDKFQVIVSNFNEEEVRLNSSIINYVEEIALGKAREVSKRVNEDNIIIGADTIVVIEDKILGKPLDEVDAFNTLKKLSGKLHCVYTSVAIINNKNNKVVKDTVCTEVKFSNLSDDEIKKYIKTKEPMDKAGSYGIQGIGGTFVEEIRGCYYNVVGLPLNRLRKMLLEII